MRKTLLFMSLAGVLVAAPTIASAQPGGYYHGECRDKRITGTVLGGLGGGAIGAAAAAGVAVTPWAWAGAGIGALIGHAIGVGACHHPYYSYDDRYDRDYDDDYPPPPPRYYRERYSGYGRGYYDAGYGYDRREEAPPPAYERYESRPADYDEDDYEYAPAPRG